MLDCYSLNFPLHIFRDVEHMQEVWQGFAVRILVNLWLLLPHAMPFSFFVDIVNCLFILLSSETYRCTFKYPTISKIGHIFCAENIYFCTVTVRGGRGNCQNI